MKQRPVLHLKPTPLDTAITGLTWLCLLVTCIYVAYMYAVVPEVVPSHFGVSGAPDDYSHKRLLIILLGLDAVMIGGLQLLLKYPHIYNYPSEITRENAETKYRSAIRLLRIVQFAVAVCFGYICYAIIANATGKMFGIGKAFLPVFLLLTIAPVVLYLYSNRNQDKKKHMGRDSG